MKNVQSQAEMKIAAFIWGGGGLLSLLWGWVSRHGLNVCCGSWLALNVVCYIDLFAPVA